MIERAHADLHDLDAAEDAHASTGRGAGSADGQLALALGSTAPSLPAHQRRVLDELAKIDPDATTPLEALEALSRWRRDLEGE